MGKVIPNSSYQFDCILKGSGQGYLYNAVFVETVGILDIFHIFFKNGQSFEICYLFSSLYIQIES